MKPSSRTTSSPSTPVVPMESNTPRTPSSGEADAYKIRWDNHADRILKVVNCFQAGRFLADVVLRVQNEEIPCHRLVLAAGSGVFCEYFLAQDNQTTWKTEIPIGSFRAEVVKAALHLMYSGETQVKQEHLVEFLTFAQAIQLRGCVGEGDAQLHSTEQASNSVFGSSTTTSLEACLPSPNSSISSSGSGKSGITSQDSGIDFDDEDGIPVDLSQVKHDNGSGSEDERTSVASNKTLISHHDDPDDSEASRTVSAYSEESAGEENIVAAGLLLHSHLLSSLARQNTTISVAAAGHNFEYRSFAQQRGTRKYKRYDQGDMKKAVDDVINNRCSALQASKIYNVPNRTLYDQVKRQLNGKSDEKKEITSVDDILHKVTKSASAIKKEKVKETRSADKVSQKASKLESSTKIKKEKA